MRRSLALSFPQITRNVRRPFFELKLDVNGIKIGIAIGTNGLLIAVQRYSHRLMIAIGKWGRR